MIGKIANAPDGSNRYLGWVEMFNGEKYVEKITWCYRCADETSDALVRFSIKEMSNEKEIAAHLIELGSVEHRGWKRIAGLPNARIRSLEDKRAFYTHHGIKTEYSSDRFELHATYFRYLLIVRTPLDQESAIEMVRRFRRDGYLIVPETWELDHFAREPHVYGRNPRDQRPNRSDYGWLIDDPPTLIDSQVFDPLSREDDADSWPYDDSE